MRNLKSSSLFAYFNLGSSRHVSGVLRDNLFLQNETHDINLQEMGGMKITFGELLELIGMCW